MLETPTRDTNKSQTVRRALTILEIIAQKREGVSVAYVMKTLSLPHSAVYRSLNDLVEFGYVLKFNSGRLYMPSLKLLTLTRTLTSNETTAHLISDSLIRMATVTGETCNCLTLEGHAVVIIHQAIGKNPNPNVTSIGMSFPAYVTATGKAILSTLSKTSIVSKTSGGIIALTPNTITDPFRYMNELETTKQRGYAIDDGEYAIAQRSVAAPVETNKEPSYQALSICGPSSRFSMPYLNYLGGLLRDEVKLLNENLNKKRLHKHANSP